MITYGDHGWQLDRLPPRKWKFHRDSLDQPVGIRWEVGSEVLIAPLDGMLWLDGYPAKGSPMDAIKRILKEEHESANYRSELWENGARLDVIIRRPLAAPSWTKQVRDRFKASWRDGQAGGTRLLEDSMEVQEVNRLSPQDAEQSQARVIAKAEIAAFFGVDQTLVGSSEAANYSNVAAYNEILDNAVLASLLVQLQQALNLRVLPVIGPKPGEYLEFTATRNRGNREKQLDSVGKAIGVPPMTPNEGRQSLNLNRIEGNPVMDELVIPIYIQDPEAAPEGDQ